MDFDFRAVEKKWRSEWEQNGTYKVTEDPTRPKYYVLDMFPYPSGAGLHVGHPLGYVASDIYARYKRLKGFNVLHPMGYDAFGLPAEQYAIETGTPPEVTTEKAIKTYRSQLDKIGFSFDWSRQVKTCDPQYYKWTQWIFLQLFGSWYNRDTGKAESIETLNEYFNQNGCLGWEQYDPADHDEFTAEEWENFSDEEQQQIFMHYRIAYQSYSEVNWCEALGTVLANDEVKDGKSERGGYPVERRKMRQWFLRITEYADRLLAGLDTLDWSEAMKDMQRNWIGRSEGALIDFRIEQPLQPLSNLSPKERGLIANTTSLQPLSKEERHNNQNDNNISKKNARPRYYHSDDRTWKHNFKLAKEHRHDPTDEEDLVWQRLRAERIGFKIRRQHPIGQFIPDFVCIRKGLIIEIDGKIHVGSIEADKERTNTLAEYGFEVIRFSNEQVHLNIDNVIKTIELKLSSMEDKDYDVTNDDVFLLSPLERGRERGEIEEGVAVSPLSLGEGLGVRRLTVFTTRPDTIYGATFMVIAPEHELVASLTTPAQQKEVEDYITYVKSRTDVERQQEKKVTGAFTGSYAINPFTEQPIPIYLAEYVLAGYGTGAIMAVPADDERDRKFAEKFGLPIVEIIDKSAHPGADIGDKVGTMIHSGPYSGMEVKDAIKAIIHHIEEMGIGKRKINYRLRDAGYSRQRYWGEPFPIVYKNDIPYPLPISELPVKLPQVDSYKPTGDGRSPLANSTAWINHNGGTRETDTMPGYAGSSWYFLRYMDPHNDKKFAAKDKLDYWQNVDLYLGGSEHAVGHLLYARLWHKFLYDLGYVPTEEPFKKLVNQGMIQGVSEKIAILNGTGSAQNSLSIADYHSFHFGNELKRFLYSADWVKEGYNPNEDDSTTLTEMHVPIEFVKNNVLDINSFIDSTRGSQYRNDVFICTGGYWINNQFFDVKQHRENPSKEFKTRSQVEKMSKSKYNVVNPDEVIEKYGADCFRMFEMFLGPLDQSKPWDDKGIDGVGKFLRRFWRLFYDDKGNWRVSGQAVSPLSSGEGPGLRNGRQEAVSSPPVSGGAGGGKAADVVPSIAEYKVLHKTLKKIAEDIERLQFNTCISQFMICLNELTDLKCNKREILEPLLIALAPFAPFLTEELWQALGNTSSIHHASFPAIEEKYLVESTYTYPVSINGKTRAEIPLALDLTEDAVKAAVLANETVQKWLNGTHPKKFIYVKGRIINVVV